MTSSTTVSPHSDILAILMHASLLFARLQCTASCACIITVLQPTGNYQCSTACREVQASKRSTEQQQSAEGEGLCVHCARSEGHEAGGAAGGGHQQEAHGQA
jgi:hypothetical protein